MTDITTVAVVDDDPGEAEVIGFAVQDAGFTPVIVPRDHYEYPSDLAQVIFSSAEAAVCDHRLQDMAFAPFDGASLVAELRKHGTPAVLVTQFVNTDSDVSIRRWRQFIPVLLKRGEADSNTIKAGLLTCLREINGETLPGRNPRRTLVRVVTVTNEAGETVIDAIVPAWNPYEAVRFPASLLPESWRTEITRDNRLFARVNIGAQRSEDLFFYDFEIAAEPDEDDGLA